LKWRLRWGDKTDFLADVEALGLESKALDSRPTVYPWMTEYISGFDVLSTRRTNGMALNPISLHEIESYIRLFEIEDSIIFIHFIILMDSEFLNYHNERINSKNRS